MDPISQGALGAAVPQGISRKKHVAAASLFGAVSGITPDLDALIRSATDPLLHMEYHRQFTHSLVFIPVGSLICALLFYWILARRWQLSFGRTYLFCFLGYATHGLLDACTSYGTELLWPFSNERFVWNNISIVDPIFTLPLLTLVILGVRRHNPVFGRVALGWALAYLSLGVYQHQRVADAGMQLANERGHEVVRMEVVPSFANILLWKVIYEFEDGYYTDAVRAAPSITIYPGEFIPRLDVARDLPWLDPDSQQATDLERFRHFSRHYLSLDPNDPQRVVSVRYSMVPDEGNGMWSIGLNRYASKTDHVTLGQTRGMPAPQRVRLLQLLRGEAVLPDRP
jgi:inner membrane protein